MYIQTKLYLQESEYEFFLKYLEKYVEEYVFAGDRLTTLRIGQCYIAVSQLEDFIVLIRNCYENHDPGVGMAGGSVW